MRHVNRGWSDEHDIFPGTKDIVRSIGDTSLSHMSTGPGESRWKSVLMKDTRKCNLVTTCPSELHCLSISKCRVFNSAIGPLGQPISLWMVWDWPAFQDSQSLAHFQLNVGNALSGQPVVHDRCSYTERFLIRDGRDFTPLREIVDHLPVLSAMIS